MADNRCEDCLDKDTCAHDLPCREITIPIVCPMCHKNDRLVTVTGGHGDNDDELGEYEYLSCECTRCANHFLLTVYDKATYRAANADLIAEFDKKVLDEGAGATR